MPGKEDRPDEAQAAACTRAPRTDALPQVSGTASRQSSRGWFVAPVSLALLALILPVLTLGLRAAGSLGFEGDGWDRWAGKIVAVQPGSPAARAGLEAGDTIVSSSLSSSDRIRLVAPPPGRVFSFDVFDGRAGRRARAGDEASARSGQGRIRHRLHDSLARL